jgi:hypothetical protein
MKIIYALSIALLFISTSCKKDKPDQPAGPPAPLTGKLKDMTERNLPSPAYHFEYDDAGAISKASIYSGLVSYNIRYDGKKILRMESTTNRDTLQYEYFDGGLTVILVKDMNGVIYRRCLVTFSTSSGQLQNLEWQVREGNVGYAIERTHKFSYSPGGNVSEIITHMYPVGSQQEATYSDKFDDYDDKVNTDGFSLLHPFQLEHLILLPEFKLQLNNPRLEIRTGDGANFQVNYTYTYDASGRPLVKTGDFLWTNGTDNGKHVAIQTTYSYY